MAVSSTSGSNAENIPSIYSGERAVSAAAVFASAPVAWMPEDNFSVPGPRWLCSDYRPQAELGGSLLKRQGDQRRENICSLSLSHPLLAERAYSDLRRGL